MRILERTWNVCSWYNMETVRGGLMRINKKMNFVKANMLFCIGNPAFIVGLLLLGGCSEMQLQKEEEYGKTISDIAYVVNTQEECLVYIKESKSFEPYLVISPDYGGNVLLLRKICWQIQCHSMKTKGICGQVMNMVDIMKKAVLIII